MAPRPGGEADKLGNRYEGAWAIRHALYCILDSTRSITAEDISDDLGNGSEFTYFHDGFTEVYQLKRQSRNSNNWSIKALAGQGIFRAAIAHVAAGRQYHFASLIPCGSLKELAERARRSADLTAFTQSWMTQELRSAFDQLSAAEVLGSAQAAWTTLRGMWFEVHEEDDVIRMNSLLAELVLEGAIGHLISLAIGDVLLDNLGKRLSRFELIEQLMLLGITPLAAGSHASAGEQVKAVTDSWRGTVQRELLDPYIARDEAAQLIRALEDNQLALLLGTAGGGKSSVLVQTLTSLRNSGAEVLALRLDRVEPFASTIELGRQLGLSMSPAVALALAANGRCAYLIVDQLDAVSLASGRMPQSFDIVMDLIGEALSVANVRVILACREFDAENDHRIRALSGRSDVVKVSVGLLPSTTVKAAVERMGLDSALLTTTQVEVLKTPLHLVLLASIAGQSEALSFQTRGSLFGAFWDRKRQSVRARREGVRFVETLARVAHEASDRQMLSVPIEVLDKDDLIDDANVLVSEHVLARDGDRIAFFHETFFDYVFARQWVSRSESLAEFLLHDEQELFRRGQVRQILQHLHEREPERFRLELEALLVRADIRYHIKDTALSVFANLPSPTNEEVELAVRLAAAKPSWEDRLWQQLRRSQWFKQFHEGGYITAWLDSRDDALMFRALNLMVRGADEHCDDVVDILEARSTIPEYTNWVRWVLSYADVSSNRRLFDLLLKAVRDGAYDNAESELWLSVHELAKNQPIWAVELIQARLVDHVHALALSAEGKVITLSLREYGASEMVRESAAAEPLKFVEVIVPYLLSVMSATEYGPRDDSPRKDRQFAARLPDKGNDDRELDDAVLSATVRALEVLVQTHADTAWPILKVLAEDQHEAAQFLLYRALSVDEGRFSNWAGELLLQGAQRLDCGYLTNRRWVARELVVSVAAHVDDEIHRRLEDHFRDLRVSYESGQNFGWTAFTFLSALDESRLSKFGSRRLQEYRRKFQQNAPSAPRGIIGGSVASPISANAAAKMTDLQWLKAMVKHDKEGRDDRDWTVLKGGAQELSYVLRGQTASDPGRFARLALRMATDVSPAYADAILLGFGDAQPDVDADAVFTAIRHISSLGHADHDRCLGPALHPRLRETPLDLVQLILDRTLHSSDPTDNTPIITMTRNDVEWGAGLYVNGINTARGSLAELLGDLLVYDTDGQRTEIVRPHLNALAADPVLSVRTCVAHTIAASLRYARPAAYAAFGLLIEADSAILAAPRVQQLMMYIGNVNPEMIEPVIDRMLVSENEEVLEAGGRLAAFAALEWDRPELLTRAREADGPVRRGAAQVCAARLDRTSNAGLATEALLQFANDREDDVRKAAAEVASNLREHALRPFAVLLGGLIDSPSYEHATPQLLITLEHAPDQIDDLTLRAAQRFLSVHGKQAGDIRTSAAGDARYISELVVRGLAQSRDRVHRAALLNILDRLLELDAYGIGRAIEDSERL